MEASQLRRSQQPRLGSCRPHLFWSHRRSPLTASRNKCTDLYRRGRAGLTGEGSGTSFMDLGSNAPSLLVAGNATQSLDQLSFDDRSVKAGTLVLFRSARLLSLPTGLAQTREMCSALALVLVPFVTLGPKILTLT